MLKGEIMGEVARPDYVRRLQEISAEIRGLPEALGDEPPDLAEHAGGLFAEAVGLGAFVGAEFAKLRLLIGRQKKWYPGDWERGVWDEAVGCLACHLPSMGSVRVWRDACAPIADLIEEQVRMIDALPRAKAGQGEGKGGADDCADWITVSEAALISGVNKGVISRAADADEIKSNGKSGRARRLDPGSFSHWAIERSPAAESIPDPETLVARAKEARRKRGVIDDD